MSDCYNNFMFKTIIIGCIIFYNRDFNDFLRDSDQIHILLVGKKCILIAIVNTQVKFTDKFIARRMIKLLQMKPVLTIVTRQR